MLLENFSEGKFLYSDCFDNVKETKEAASSTLLFIFPCLAYVQVERGEFQQESVLKQLEVLQEDEKEYQHIKVGPGTRMMERGRKEIEKEKEKDRRRQARG